MAEHTVPASHQLEEHGHPEHHEVIERGVHVVHSTKKEIWKIFVVLLLLTILEFLIALTPAIQRAMEGHKATLAAIYLFLTVMKAFYIVSYFMHLKHEKINMAYTILIPLGFIVYLIILLMLEGTNTLRL